MAHSFPSHPNMAYPNAYPPNLQQQQRLPVSQNVSSSSYTSTSYGPAPPPIQQQTMSQSIQQPVQHVPNFNNQQYLQQSQGAIQTVQPQSQFPPPLSMANHSQYQQQQQQPQQSSQYTSQMDQLSGKMNSMSVTNQSWSTMWQNEAVNLMSEKEIRTKSIQQELQREQQKRQQEEADPIPDEFIYDFSRQRHIDIMNRPELNYGSIEYVASVEYMVRPPQPATYLFVFECTASSVHSGYIRRFANALLESLDRIPGDARTLVGFIAFDSKLHFFNLNDERPVHYIMPDIDDIFIPHTDSVLVNLKTHRSKIEYFLRNVLSTFPFDSDSNSLENIADNEAALGPALQVAFKIISSSGGRITLIQTSLPNAGPKSDGSVLVNREDPNQRTANSSNSTAALTPLLNPSTDFYKKLSLECSEQQVTVDLFNLSSSYSDLATVGTIARFSGGSILYYGGGGTPSSPNAINAMLTRFEADMKHYLTRPIGFEAVMRLRSTRGISIHTFHGNFFVRSTDLIALPNVNPDSSFAMQMTINEDLKDYSQVCLQAALLYTASNGERRIRVHTIALPVVTIMNEVLGGADQEAIVGLLAKMAVDRSTQSNVQDAREALINANVDIINTFRVINSNQYAGLMTSSSTKLLPLFTLALMKHTAFRLGISTRIDERVYAMLQMKSLPIKSLLLYIYPNLYPIHYQFDPAVNPPLPVQLTFANIDRNGVYLLDTYDHLFIYICKSVHPQFLADVFNVTQWSQIPDEGEQNSTSVVAGSGSALGTHGINQPLTTMGQSSGGIYNRNQIQGLPVGSSPMVNGFHNANNEQQQRRAKLVHNDSTTSAYSEETTTSTDHSPSSDRGRQLNGGDDYSSGEETKSISNVMVKKSPTVTLPLLDNPTSQRVHQFISSLIDNRPFKPNFHILREDSRLRYSFLQYMYDDRNESAFSYYEFLQHLQNLDK
ncbi:Protein transport protein Sec24B [Blomia tropicalis]|nr:Protein transport protein Sec24B [Blomia tropicalis]